VGHTAEAPTEADKKAADKILAKNEEELQEVVVAVEGKPLHSVWRQCYLWSFPYYMVGGVLAAIMLVLERSYLIYQWYRSFAEVTAARAYDAALRGAEQFANLVENITRCHESDLVRSNSFTSRVPVPLSPSSGPFLSLVELVVARVLDCQPSDRSYPNETGGPEWVPFRMRS
jgi:hypothetical protein